jgi:PAS domain-containing protein
MKMLSRAALVAAPLAFASGMPAAAETPGWQIAVSGKDFLYNTASRLVTTKGVTAPGLTGVSRSGGHEVRTFWTTGGFGPTITFDGTLIADGQDTNAVARITGFRFDRSGDHVYLQTGKGPAAKVELMLNGEPVYEWPRLSIVSVLSFKQGNATVSVFDRDAQTTRFVELSNLSRETDGGETIATSLGYVEDCAVLGSKVLDDGIALQLFCNATQGSDVHFLSFETGQLEPVMTGEADSLFAFQLGREEGAISVLSVDGNDNARRLFHALYGAVLKDLGEPMSRASDGAGKQSWSQSYRTLTLARLYEVTKHPAFAALTVGAMENTLAQTNSNAGISGPANPACAWASRIYSRDKATPISLLINQAMIAGSLTNSCSRLGEACGPDLSARVAETGQCLVDAYEKDFDADEGLYRIPYGVNFRYDGVVAPWNWQARWAGFLDQFGSATEQPALQTRALSLAGKFTATWQNAPEGALWRYWTPTYYRGWSEADQVSLYRPRQKPDPDGRYEDLNHAGISLLGLSEIEGALNVEQRTQVTSRLAYLLEEGRFLARDLDGAGPRSPRWRPGAGWDLVASDEIRDLYAHLLPGSVSSDQHLAYANLFDPEDSFDLRLSLSYCKVGKCQVQQTWTFTSVDDFLQGNPLFEITPLR